MVTRHHEEHLNAFQQPPLEDSHWSQTSEDGSDLQSPVIYEQTFVQDSVRYHNPTMEYRTNAAAGFVLPPPTILPPGHASGWPIAAISEHTTKQEFDRIQLPHNLQPLVHDDIPLNKMSNGGYRNEDSPISPYDPSNPIKTSQSTPKPATNGSKTRPPRRSSANGVVACRQCRARKIRCDSTRPGCDNCARRSSQCEYDTVPKRRGPDKRPGTRRRSCKKRPTEGEEAQAGKKRRRTETEDERSDGNDDIIRPAGEPSYHISASPVPLVPNSTLSINTEVTRDFFAPTSTGSISPPSASHRSPDQDTMRSVIPRTMDFQQLRRSSTIMPSPSMEYPRRTWWDNLIESYAPSRAQAAKDIRANLSFLFSTHGCWVPFINSATFLQHLDDPNERIKMQPALVIAALALATIMMSSQMELGSAGRERARNLVQRANGFLHGAVNDGSTDPALAQAVLVLTLFELCPHPGHSPQRAKDHILFLDRIVRSQRLTYVDVTDPEVSAFAPKTVPVVQVRRRQGLTKCFCPRSPLEGPVAHTLLPSWASVPPWESSWSPVEVEKEECRRLCWSALSIVSCQSVTSSAFDKDPPDLFLSNPTNYAVLFPGEASLRTHPMDDAISPKESVWALHCRSMLLWNSCMRQKSERLDEKEKAEFAIEAWRESLAIQDSLDIHVCSSNTALSHSCREYLYNTRMCITTEFRRLQGADSGVVGGLNRQRHAGDWLAYQRTVAKRIESSVIESNGHSLARHPLQLGWFTTQVSICLHLWNTDRSMTDALEVAKTFLLPVDALTALFPCQAMETVRDKLHEHLNKACAFSGLPPPPPPSASMAHTPYHQPMHM